MSSDTAATASSKSKKQRWFPLESNPSLMNDYIQKLGFQSDMTGYEFTDVFSTEDWALEMVPQPVAAVIMLYPLTEKQTTYEASAESQKNVVDAAVASERNNIWFIKQRIGNACGTIGLLHALMNAPDGLKAFQPNSWLDEFASKCPPSLDPIAKAEHLETDTKISQLHDDATSSERNATDRGDIEDRIETHFIALCCVDDVLYEFDGRKAGPIAHGPTTQMTLLKDACSVVRQFMDRDPGELRFTILALAPKQQQ